MYPKISIITPNFNQGKYIEETILSIINQGYPNLEYIIIDGGSTDNSVEIIEKYDKHISYWVSEKDKGQADAINKGLAHCTGEIFNWINSDDLLAPNALFTIASLYKENATVAGRVYNFYENNSELNDYTQNENLDFLNFLMLKSVYHQPGIWLNLKHIKGLYLDTENHYYFDLFFYINHFKNNKEIIYTDNILAHFRFHSESKTTLIQNKSQTEIIQFYQGLYHAKDYRPQRRLIRKVLKYFEANKEIKRWLEMPAEQKNRINFFKFFTSNLSYLEVNVFWKFIIKYMINFQNIRIKHH
ncbi:MAG TPA: glycosyltransferase family 2 protein [Pelobium sp.]|nr:glycosyltransferase family 2 protein [Pelobium sp.]